MLHPVCTCVCLYATFSLMQFMNAFVLVLQLIKIESRRCIQQEDDKGILRHVTGIYSLMVINLQENGTVELIGLPKQHIKGLMTITHTCTTTFF